MQPDTFKVVENKEVDKALGELFEKGGAYEMLLTSAAWAHLQDFIRSRISAFSTKAIINGFDTMEQMQFERGVVFGLRSLLIEVDSTLEALKSERKKNGSDTGNE